MRFEHGARTRGYATAPGTACRVAAVCSAGSAALLTQAANDAHSREVVNLGGPLATEVFWLLVVDA
jgi:hypothetical protein